MDAIIAGFAANLDKFALALVAIVAIVVLGPRVVDAKLGRLASGGDTLQAPIDGPGAAPVNGKPATQKDIDLSIARHITDCHGLEKVNQRLDKMDTKIEDGRVATAASIERVYRRIETMEINLRTEIRESISRERG